MRAEGSKEPQAGHGAVTKAEQMAEGLDFEIWTATATSCEATEQSILKAGSVDGARCSTH